MQRLQDTDAFILLDFGRAIKGLNDAQIVQVGAKFLTRLTNNGHTRADAIALLRGTLKIELESRHAAP